MADNVPIHSPASGTSVATDEVGGVHYQRIKLAFGADGAANDVNPSNPLPVSAPPLGDANVAGVVTARKRVIVTTDGTSGDKQIVAAVGSKKIRVLKLQYHVVGAATLIFKSAGTTMIGAHAPAANVWHPLEGPGQDWLFESPNVNEAFQVNVSAAVVVLVIAHYVEVA